MLVSWGGGRVSKDFIFLPLGYKIKSDFEVMKVEFVLKASGTIPEATGRHHGVTLAHLLQVQGINQCAQTTLGCNLLHLAHQKPWPGSTTTGNTNIQLL